MDRLDIDILKHHQGTRLCLGAFRTAPVESLYVEANEPSLDLRRLTLTLQYIIKLIENIDNPAYNYVFHPLRVCMTKTKSV